MRRITILALMMLIGVVAWTNSSAQEPEPTLRLKTPTRAAVTKLVVVDVSENLVAAHDPASSSYDENCLSCHSSVLTDQTQDPRILSFHQAMLPYTPGYNPRHGATNNTCVQCHRFVEIREDSAGALRKHVDPEMCALCHGPSGPGPVYYER
ncbi:MAG: hypothetical protein GY906_05625 [bacterium]|nr:hypothetical protein [bacterium]